MIKILKLQGKILFYQNKRKNRYKQEVPKMKKILIEITMNILTLLLVTNCIIFYVCQLKAQPFAFDPILCVISPVIAGVAWYFGNKRIEEAH